MIFLSGLVQRWTTVSLGIDARPTCGTSISRPDHVGLSHAPDLLYFCGLRDLGAPPISGRSRSDRIRNELTRKLRTAFGPVAGSGPQQRQAATSRRTAPYFDLVQLPELLHQVKDKNMLQNEEQKMRITHSRKESELALIAF